MPKKERLITWRDVREYDFKHAGIMQPILRSTGLFYKRIGQSVLFVDHGVGGVFNLSVKHAKMFAAGTISLVPPDSVSVTGRRTREFNMRKDVMNIPYAKFMRMVKRGHTTCPD
jgi:hypothetical protein